MLTSAVEEGAPRSRRIDGGALLAWLEGNNPHRSIPAHEMLAALQRCGFDATMVEGLVVYEGGALEEWSNNFPKEQDGELVWDTTSGPHNAGDVLDFLLEALPGGRPMVSAIGIGGHYSGRVRVLAERLGLPVPRR